MDRFLCLLIAHFDRLLLVILKAPDTLYSGLDRGAAIWRLLTRILVKPFEVMGLISSRLRGKAKRKFYYEKFGVLGICRLVLFLRLIYIFRHMWL